MAEIWWVPCVPAICPLGIIWFIVWLAEEFCELLERWLLDAPAELVAVPFLLFEVDVEVVP